MSFRIRQVDYRPWPVTVTLLSSDEAGNVTEQKHTFVGHFGDFNEASYDALVREAETLHPKRDGQQDTVNTLKHNAHVFCGVLIGWGAEVTDDNDKPIPFTKERLTGLVTGKDGIAISNGINQAVNQLRFGIAPEKNSLTSPEPGPTPELAEVANETKQS